MASVAREPFDSADWIFETKLDRYRAITVIDSTGKARIWSRNRLPLEQKFPTVRDAVEALNLRSTILDGEIVALDQEGVPGFNYFKNGKERGFEGIIAKRKVSIYQPGKRSPDWLKIKSRPQQEFIVCGFTEGKGSRLKSFGTLLLGGYRDGKLRYFGHSGSGFSEKGLPEAIERLSPLFIDRAPVANPPNPMVRPHLVRWRSPNGPKDEQLRQTTFLGWRDDSRPEDAC